MKILAVGGGSGGHVTPVVAVLHEIQERNPRAELQFWSDKKFTSKVKQSVQSLTPMPAVRTISSGKFRRYNHLTLWQHITMPGVVIPNVLDTVRVLAGTVQSTVRLLTWRPDVIFLKGGFVCLPVGWAARLLRIPYVIHDSDAHPGLTNRLLAKHARIIATGAPLKYYDYPADKARYVGIPVQRSYRRFEAHERQVLRRAAGFDPDKPLITVTGGGLGARRINDAIVSRQDEYESLAQVALIAGSDQYEELQLGSNGSCAFKFYGFIAPDQMQKLLAAADIVITRAGATTMLELAALGKPSIVVPNQRLTGGHQVKNAQVYADANAVELVTEDDSQTVEELGEAIYRTAVRLIEDPVRQQELSDAIISLARPHAASDTATMILEAAQGGGVQ